MANNFFSFRLLLYAKHPIGKKRKVKTHLRKEVDWNGLGRQKWFTPEAFLGGCSGKIKKIFLGLFGITRDVDKPLDAFTFPNRLNEVTQ